MSKKHHQPEEEPIDKIEHFLQNNFQKILIVVAVIIIVSLVGFMVKKNMDLKQVAKQNKLGEYEVYLITGQADNNKIEEYKASAEEIGMQDYAYFQIARFYLNKDDKAEAIKTLKMVSGDFKELADSLLYDLGALNAIPTEYLSDSYLVQIWKYRQILANNENSKDVDNFKKTYPNSSLLDLLENWEKL